VKNGLTEIASLLLRKGQVREDGGIFRQELRRTAEKRYSLVMMTEPGMSHAQQVCHRR
jgi:hypothetical protein